MVQNSVSLQSMADRDLHKISRIFDKSAKPNWRSIIDAFPKEMYTPQQIEKIGIAILRPKGSPTIDLIKDLAKRGKTYSELLRYLNVLIQKGYDKGGAVSEAVTLLQHSTREPNQFSYNNSVVHRIEILSHPLPMIGLIGDGIEMRCQGRGEGPLCFQWFHGNQPTGANSNVFQIASLSNNDSGYYICRVSNSSSCAFTNWARIEVVPTHLKMLESAPLITVHPRALSCFVGENFQLFCDAVGSPEPEFQWYFDDQLIDRATERQFVCESAEMSASGLYSCVSMNSFGTVRSFSARVSVLDGRKVRNQQIPRGSRPSSVSPDLESMYGSFPVFKVALLIGNENYQHQDDLGKLVHPGNDARDIAGALTSIGFKVVSLLDLNLEEFRNAVSMFCQLLSEDVYAVFYFAGHGFEVHGESYLMPTDATDSFQTNENYPTSEILADMIKRKCKLTMLILDCCRTMPDSYQGDPLPKLCQSLQATQSNVALCFGCCTQSRVLESPLHANGFLAESICQHVSKNITIDSFMFEIGRSMHNKRIIDPATGRAQVIYRHSSLVEELSLCDPIIIASSLDVDQQRMFNSWKLLHEAPVSPITVFHNDFVRLDFIFSAEFSNVLLIQSRIYSTADCVVRFLLPASIGGAKVEILSQEKGIKGQASNAEVVKVSNLELLDGDVTIHIEVTYNNGNERVRQMAFYSLADKPLYSKIRDLELL